MRVLTIVGKAAVFDHGGSVDPVRFQELAQLLPAAIRPQQTDDRRSRDELAEVARHVGRAAGVKTLARHFHHRHRRLGRNAADFSPDELVQHQIAEDENAFGAGGGQDFSQARRAHTRTAGAGKRISDRCLRLCEFMR